ncbi:zinc-binding dehydrogenase [Actinopolymorpha sp. B11F2]|uniref:zinc-binding dehydrogenase n=1 Tax=Actinopolymorpha sp. B11F2 TaxID=3160862 RepID=UPI0032E5061D
MRSLVVDHSVPGHIRLGEAPEPEPGPAQVLIDVKTASLNCGELAYARGAAEEGTVLGWDTAGVVRRGAGDGSGPAVGTRVVGFAGSGGWAERRALDSADVAVVPDDVELGAAVTLPVAGGTALRALRRLGFVAGERVLVTGASGGVGRFAVQIAALAGAHVIASVGSPERGEGLAELGAAEVVVGLDAIDEPLFGVIDNVGGPQLVQAFGLLGEGGSIQSIGGTSGEPAVFAPYGTVGLYRKIEAFDNTLGDMGRHLAPLLRWLAAGKLDPQIGWRGDWSRAGEAVELLIGRKLPGKAVLEIA